jgi:hypothetical protein
MSLCSFVKPEMFGLIIAPKLANCRTPDTLRNIVLETAFGGSYGRMEVPIAIH